jgi:hypothetical protein
MREMEMERARERGEEEKAHMQRVAIVVTPKACLHDLLLLA